jgi:hypothetical protein
MEWIVYLLLGVTRWKSSTTATLGILDVYFATSLMHYMRVASLCLTAESYYIPIHCVTLRKMHSSFLQTGTEENEKKRKREYVN